MKERPILFSAPMVRALLAGTKTQTRRVAKPKRSIEPMTDECPYGRPGDRLWVRETWAVPHRYDHLGPSNIPVLGVPTHYAATEDRGGLRWRPSIHMCRWVSRITLQIIDVRVERLQKISVEDCIAEGARCWVCDGPIDGTSENDCACFHTKAAARDSYRALWESINGSESWEANPWVWAITFRRLP